MSELKRIIATLQHCQLYNKSIENIVIVSFVITVKVYTYEYFIEKYDSYVPNVVNYLIQN